jgi:hypothetical protein
MHHSESLDDAQWEARVKAITLRNLPPELARMVRRQATERQISINKAVISLLEGATGTVRRKQTTLHHDLDELAGSWTEAEAAEFEGTLAQQRGIDRDLWK